MKTWVTVFVVKGSPFFVQATARTAQIATQAALDAATKAGFGVSLFVGTVPLAKLRDAADREVTAFAG